MLFWMFCRPQIVRCKLAINQFSEWKSKESEETENFFREKKFNLRSFLVFGF